MKRYFSGIGQDSHRFLEEKDEKKCVIGGLVFEDVPGFSADSDGDIIFHAICNAITSITHVPILGQLAIELCHQQGITDSKYYLEKALESMKGFQIEHVALTIEGKRPKFQKHIDALRHSVASCLKIKAGQVGLTVTSGDGLSDFGQGKGLMCFCILSVSADEL